MAKMPHDARIRTHARRFHVVFCVKWTEDGYPRQRRFDRLLESLSFWLKLKYLEFHNLKWEIE